MEYQIVKRNAFRIVGFRTPIPMDQEMSFQAVPRFWETAGPKLPQLFPLMSPEMPGVLGVCTCYKDQDNYYYIAVASDAPILEGMYEWIVPASAWAVFSGAGRLPLAIQNLQRRAVSEWLPGSGYEWAKAPDIEVYLDPPGGLESRFQIWLPVTQS